MAWIFNFQIVISNKQGPKLCKEFSKFDRKYFRLITQNQIGHKSLRVQDPIENKNYYYKKFVKYMKKYLLTDCFLYFDTVIHIYKYFSLLLYCMTLLPTKLGSCLLYMAFYKIWILPII